MFSGAAFNNSINNIFKDKQIEVGCLPTLCTVDDFTVFCCNKFLSAFLSF